MSKTDEFIRKAKLKHGDTYDYSKVECKKSKDKVIIICKTHGEFQQIPSNHLFGSGCNKCGYCKSTEKLRSNTEEFIRKSKLKHNDTYDYSKTEYKTDYIKIIIMCKNTGNFHKHRIVIYKTAVVINVVLNEEHHCAIVIQKSL